MLFAYPIFGKKKSETGESWVERNKVEIKPCHSAAVRSTGQILDGGRRFFIKEILEFSDPAGKPLHWNQAQHFIM